MMFLSACDDSQPDKKIAAKQAIKEVVATLVVVEEIAVNYRTTGSVVSDQRIQVASRTTGYIQKILVREGDQVKKGQLLLELDGADVEGAIQQIKANVNKSNSALKDAQTDLDRFQSLFKRGSVSENKLRKVRLQRDIARDTLLEAKAVLKTAKSQRQYTQITSPIDGVVVARQKREGDLAMPSVPLLTLESTAGLLFETYIAEGQLKNIKQGDSVQVEIDALAKSLQGIVARVVPSGNPLTRKSLVKISLNDEEGLLPGMFGRTYFKVGVESLPLISVDSLCVRGSLRGVFVVEENETAYFRWLQLGKTNAGKIEVIAGLEKGEHVIESPSEQLHDGDKVQLKRF